MKPWFEKEIQEADIIKFPEPERKVIKMPSVSEYPDFLTGVKDLHNGLEKGEISQDSHDKLYQDLIHRFMKKESFETPWFLREAPVGAPNRGHALEFHLAVGIHERLKKVNYLTRDELVNAILKYGKKTTIGDEFSDKEDTFVLQGNITGPVVKHNTIQNLQPGAIFDPNIRGVLKFVNKELDKQIRFIHNNNRKDKVVASTVGIGGDKVDLQVLVIYKDQSGKEIKEPIDDLSMSLKFKSREFGQTKISTKGGQSGSIENLKTVIDKQFVKLFTHLGFPNTYNRIGKPIVDSLLADKNYTKNWLTWRENYKVNPGRYDLRKKEGPPGSEKVLVINEIAKQYMTDLYQKMSDAMNITFKGKNGELKEKEVIGNFLINELTGGENLSVLKFDDNAYTKMSASKLKELQKLLRKIEIRVEFATSSKEGSVDPYLYFKNVENGEIIFNIRNTIDGEHVIKNVYEQGPGLNKYKEKVDY